MNDESRKRIMLIITGMMLISLAWIIVEVVPNESQDCFKFKSVTVLLGNKSFSFLQQRFSGPNWVDCDDFKSKSYWECQKIKLETEMEYPIWLKTEFNGVNVKQGIMTESSAGEWCKSGR